MSAGTTIDQHHVSTLDQTAHCVIIEQKFDIDVSRLSKVSTLISLLCLGSRVSINQHTFSFTVEQ